MLNFKVIYEDSWILIVDKPAGFYSHAPVAIQKSRRISPRWNGLSILKNSTGLKNLSPVHRLDQKTSGLWMLSKTIKERDLFQKLFFHGQVQKEYICAIRGKLPSESFSFFFLQDKGLIIPARTTVSSLFSTKLNDRPISLVKAKLITGKTNQIRKHFSSVGHPILNDKKFGDKKWNRELKQLGTSDVLYLRSKIMKFTHPILKKEISLQAPWNRHWHILFEKIGFCAI